MYDVSGDVSEFVLMLTEPHNVPALQKALSAIFGAYECDLGKHPNLVCFLRSQ